MLAWPSFHTLSGCCGTLIICVKSLYSTGQEPKSVQCLRRSQMKGVEENFLGQIEHASFVLYRSPHGCVDWLIDSLHIKRHGISSRRQFYGEIFQDILVVFKPYVRERTLIAIVTQEWYSLIGPSTF